MNYAYIYEPAALEELREAVIWYGERSEIAARNFIVELKEKLKAICENPFGYRNSYRYFRETSLKKYPYYIVYFLDEKEKIIIVSSIYHHKRNPKKKYRK